MAPMFENRFTKSAGRRWAPGLLLAIVLLCVYCPVVTSDYLYHDDWIHFNARASACDASPMYNWSRITGRPVGHYALCGLFRLFQTTDQAWRARLVIVGGIAAFALLQSLYLRALGISSLAAVSLALGTSVLPGMLVLGYWITAGSIICSLLSSAAAALLTAAGLRPETGLARRAAFLVGGGGLQLTALLIYQTGAMYFWSLTGVMLATALWRGDRTAVRSLAVYTIVGGGPMAGYFIWFKYVSGLAALLQAQDPLRGTMSSDLAGRAFWFFTALPKASLLWFFDLSRGWGQAAVVIFVLSLILSSARLCWMARRRGDRAGSFLGVAYPVVIATLGVLTFLPMLATSFHLALFRSLIPLSSLLFLTGAIHLGITLRAEKWPRPVKAWMAAGFVIGVSSFAAHSLVSRMVLPAAAEYSFVRGSLLDAARNGPPTGKVHAVIPERTREFKTDEVGSLSAWFVRDTRPMVQLIGRELGIEVSQVSQTLQGVPFEQEGALVLDFAKLSQGGLWRSYSAGDATVDRGPVTLWFYPGHHLVRFRGLVYAVPESLGEVDWNSGPVERLPGVITGATAREVIGHLPAATIDPDPRLLRRHGAYNLVAYRGRIYALPLSLGPVEDWADGKVAKLPGVLTGASVEEVVSRLPPDETIDPQPRLLHTHHRYNLVSYRGRIYALPLSLGPVEDWAGGKVAKLPGVLTGASVEEVISRLPPDETIDPQPRLLRTHRGYNLVSYRGRIYAVPLALGVVANWKSGQVGKLPGVVTGATVEEVLARLPK